MLTAAASQTMPAPTFLFATAVSSPSLQSISPSTINTLLPGGTAATAASSCRAQGCVLSGRKCHTCSWGGNGN